jgi:hypothetical protein
MRMIRRRTGRRRRRRRRSRRRRRRRRRRMRMRRRRRRRRRRRSSEGHGTRRVNGDQRRGVERIRRGRACAGGAGGSSSGTPLYTSARILPVLCPAPLPPPP